MKKIFQPVFLSLVAFLSIVSCTNNPLRPADISNIPSGIIVKEKSISGNFDSVVVNISYNIGSDSILPDSIHDNISGQNIFINHSRFIQNKIIYFGRDSDLRDIDGDSVALAAHFDDNDMIDGVYWMYAVNHNYPFFVSEQMTFNYDSQKRLLSLPAYGRPNGSGGCNADMLYSSGNFYTNLSSNDSLVLAYESPSCAFNSSDTMIVTFLDKHNNSNLALLSFPSMPATYFTSSNDYMSFVQFLPFPKLNGELIDKVYYPRLNLSYTNSYTFDSEGRVKTAKIAYNYLYNTLRERLIEFNY